MKKCNREGAKSAKEDAKGRKKTKSLYSFAFSFAPSWL